MLKTLALISLLLFAFMGGVILGAQNSIKLKTENFNFLPKKVKLSDLNPRPEPSLPKKLTALSNQPKIQIQKSSLNKVLQAEQTQQYTLVVASFKRLSDAILQTSQLTRKGHKAFYYKSKIKGTTWYRVGIGRFPSKKEALSLKKKLSNQRLAKGSIISSLPNN